MSSRDIVIGVLLVSLGIAGTLLVQSARSDLAPAPGRKPDEGDTATVAELQRKVALLEKGLEAAKDGNTRLQSFSLQFTKISDTGLGYLENLPGLRFLNVKGSHVTTTAGQGYATRHPRCRIIH